MMNLKGDFKSAFRYPHCIRDYINPKHWYRGTKWFIQRARRGWADSDAWGTYDHIASIIPPMCRHLIKCNNGTPMMMFREEDVRREDGHISDEASDRAHKKWHKILNEIAEGFEYYDDVPDDFDWTDYDFKDEAFKKRYHEAYDAQKKKSEKAMRLFSKYFGCLWD